MERRKCLTTLGKGERMELYNEHVHGLIQGYDDEVFETRLEAEAAEEGFEDKEGLLVVERRGGWRICWTDKRERGRRWTH